MNKIYTLKLKAFVATAHQQSAKLRAPLFINPAQREQPPSRVKNPSDCYVDVLYEIEARAATSRNTHTIAEVVAPRNYFVMTNGETLPT
jgi:hypothetical protein